MHGESSPNSFFQRIDCLWHVGRACMGADWPKIKQKLDKLENFRIIHDYDMIIMKLLVPFYRTLLIFMSDHFQLHCNVSFNIFYPYIILPLKLLFFIQCSNKLPKWSKNLIFIANAWVISQIPIIVMIRYHLYVNIEDLQEVLYQFKIFLKF